MKIETLRKIHSLLTIAPKDETRKYLMGVHVTRLEDSKTVILVVTNGHYLTEQKVEDELLWEKLITPLLIGAENSDSIKKFLKDYKTYPLKTTFDIELEDFKHFAFGGRKVLKLALKSILYISCEESLNYPKWQQIIPAKDKMVGAFEFSFNPEYLLDLYKANTISKHPQVTLLVVPDSKTPIRISFRGVENNTTILSPMKA